MLVLHGLVSPVRASWLRLLAIHAILSLILALSAIFVDEIVILEDFAVADVDLRYFLALDASKFKHDSTHCFLFVAHAEGIRDVSHRELLLRVVCLILPCI